MSKTGRAPGVMVTRTSLLGLLPEASIYVLLIRNDLGEGKGSARARNFRAGIAGARSRPGQGIARSPRSERAPRRHHSGNWPSVVRALARARSRKASMAVRGDDRHEPDEGRAANARASQRGPTAPLGARRARRRRG